jgi:hypothetical protein
VLVHRPRLLRAAAALAALVVLAPSAASAGEDQHQLARQAYERGVEAYKHGNYAMAAQSFGEADSAAPSAVALQAAIDAAVKADDPVLGGELLERAQGRKVEGALAASVKKAEAKLGHRAGRVHLTCAKPCTAMLEGAALADGGTRWASLGDHAVSIVVDGRQATVHATVTADQTAEVAAPAEILTPPKPSQPPVVEPSGLTTSPAGPVSAPPPPPSAFGPRPLATPNPQPAHETPSGGGIGRGWFWAGVGVTAAGALGTALFFGLASSDHGTFVAQSCATTGSTKCQSLASDGFAAQILGNVMLGVGVVGAVWTVVSGIWLVHWKDSGVRASVGPTGGSLTWTRSF